MYLALSFCRFNSAEVLVYIGIPAALVLMGSSIVLDGPAMLALASKLWQINPALFLKAWAVSSAVNLTSYMAISTTSSLTFKVAGCLKNLVVVWYGVVVHQDHITAWHLLGYAVSVAGFALYTCSKSAGSAAAGAVRVQESEKKKMK